jgi:hypothetical protein
MRLLLYSAAVLTLQVGSSGSAYATFRESVEQAEVSRFRPMLGVDR